MAVNKQSKELGEYLKKVFEHLVYKRVVSTKREFSMRMGQYEVPINLMMKNERPITLTVLLGLVNEYGVNANYILSCGRGPIMISGDMFAEEGDVLPSIRIEMLEKEVGNLKEQLKTKNEMIKLLKNQTS